MLKERPCSFYWQEEYTRPIPYEIHWVDPTFLKWARSVYGSEHHLFNQVAQIVSTTPTENIAYHHPTGGRTNVFELREPFIDPHSHLPCFEMDVKGVGLTTAGYEGFTRRFGDSYTRREILVSPEDDHEAWGPEGLETADAERFNISIVNKLGILTPYPGAILLPKAFVLDGQLVDITTFKKMFRATNDDEFVLLLRAYPLSSTRASDLVGVYNLSDIVHEWYPDDIPKARDKFLNQVENARKKWSQFEYPRLKRGSNNIRSGEEFFQYIYEKTLKQLTAMLKTGFSPATGKESANQPLQHNTSLHNWTTAGALVEWSPITVINRLPLSYRRQHIERLIADAHGFIVTMGAVCLADFSVLPSMLDLLKALRRYAPKKEIITLSDEYDPDVEKSNDPTSHFRLICRLGGNDHFMEWLKDTA